MRKASGMRSLAAVWPVPDGLRKGPAVRYWSTSAPMKLIISVVSTSSVPKRTRRYPGSSDQAVPAVIAASVPHRTTSGTGPPRQPSVTTSAEQAPT